MIRLNVVLAVRIRANSYPAPKSTKKMSIEYNPPKYPELRRAGILPFEREDALAFLAKMARFHFIGLLECPRIAESLSDLAGRKSGSQVANGVLHFFRLS